MEKVHQSLGPEGLHIPIALMRQYGLGPGSAVTLELLPEGIHIVPEQVTAILFTGESNTAAQKAYVALGFRHIGAYRLLLLRTPREAAR